MSLFSNVFGKQQRKRKKNPAGSIFDRSEAFLRKTPTPKAPTKRQKLKEMLTTTNDPKPPTPDNDQDRTLFVGNLSLSIKKLPKKLTSFFKKFGEVESVRLRSVPSAIGDNAPKRVVAQHHRYQPDAVCNAYILFKDKASLQSALTANLTLFHGKHLRVDIAGQRRFQQPRKTRGAEPGQFNPKDSVFVKNLETSVSDEELLKVFNDGELVPLCRSMVRSWRVIRDHKTGLSKGYAFLSFRTPAAAKASFALNGHVFKGKKLAVEKLRHRERRRKGEGKWRTSTRQTKGRLKLKRQ